LPKKFPGEELLSKVFEDLADFLPYLVLVGGWVPYIYAKYVWKNVPSLAVTTSDIDFGVGDAGFTGKDTVASYVQRLGYGERHLSMDRMIPFVPIVKNLAGDLKAEVEFITDPNVSRTVVNKIVGREIKINEIENFGLLLESVTTAKIGKQEIRIPTASMFVFHKLLTFVQRENGEKFKKDLYYVYYMLRFSSDKEALIAQVNALIKDKKQGASVKRNLQKYFKDVSSQGPFLVEQENGPDEYIRDLRRDVFERFSRLREV